MGSLGSGRRGTLSSDKNVYTNTVLSDSQLSTASDNSHPILVVFFYFS